MFYSCAVIKMYCKLYFYITEGIFKRYISVLCALKAFFAMLSVLFKRFVFKAYMKV